jgi:hypothetical protein
VTQVAAELPPPPAPAPGRGASPYKFLDFYERRDASNFAGRDQEIDDIAAGVARSRCFVLYGRSGLGKTSLLHAGVIPRLEQRGFEVRYLRILAYPVHDLCAAVAAQIGRDAIAPDELPALLAARPRPFVLVLDQFEEFFLRFSGDPVVQSRFAGLLGKILDEGGEWVRLVISLREDYYAQLQDLQRAIPDLTAHGHRLVSLSAYGVRQAVVRPLIHAGIAYEEQFVDQVIDELAAFDFDPLLLQIVCGEVYDDAVRDARVRGDATVELRAAHIERSGGLQGALTRYVAAVSATLAGDDRLIACAVLDALAAVRPAPERSWPLGWLEITGATAGVSILAAILLGGLIGWRGSARLARSEALGQPTRVWTGAGVRGPTATVVAFLLFWLAILLVKDGRSTDRWDRGVVLAVALALTMTLWLFGPMAVRWIHRTIEPGSSTMRAVMWTTVAGSALALAATGAAATVARVLEFDESNGFELAITVFLVAGLQLCIAGLVLHGGTKSFPIGDPPSSVPAARRTARRLAVGLFVAVPILACAAQGRGWIPLFPVQPPLGSSFDGRLASDRPVYFRVATPHDAVLTFGRGVTACWVRSPGMRSRGMSWSRAANRSSSSMTWTHLQPCTTIGALSGPASHAAMRSATTARSEARSRRLFPWPRWPCSSCGRRATTSACSRIGRTARRPTSTSPTPTASTPTPSSTPA